MERCWRSKSIPHICNSWWSTSATMGPRKNGDYVCTRKSKKGISYFRQTGGIHWQPSWINVWPKKHGRLLGEKLAINNESLLKYPGTYFLAAAYNLLQNQIYNKHSFINMEGLTDQKNYQSFWNSLAKMGCIKKGNTHAHGLWPLWIDAEHALNETCRELFIEGADFYVRVTIDDDKMHYEAKDQQSAQGLKIAQYIHNNYKGVVAHTTCYTASRLPIGIEWEWSNNDTTSTATERLIRTQLPPIWVGKMDCQR